MFNFITVPAYNTYKKVTDNIHAGVQKVGTAISETTHKTSAAVGKFVYENSNTLLYTGFTVTTAALAPQFFFPAAIVTTILRIEITRFLKEMCEEYFKPEKNPMKGEARPIVSNVNLALASVAALDTVALTTLFTSTSIVINLLPALGGVAAGNSFAKMIMRWAEKRAEERRLKELAQLPPPPTVDPAVVIEADG